MDTILHNIKDKYLDSSDYIFVNESQDSLKLSDQLLIYNTGETWKAIPLMVSLSYPIIYDKYSLNNEQYDISIIVCPVTLRSVVFKGLFEFVTYNHDYRMILREKNNSNDVLMPIDLGVKIDETNGEYIVEHNRRSEIKISTVRSILTLIPDMSFIKLNKNKKIDPVLNIDYYSNDLDIDGNKIDGLIHPKTLVYIIQYKSHTTKKDKVSIMIGKDIDQYNITGYDTRKSEIFNYLDKYSKKIIHKKGFIIPMLWYIAKDIYKQSRIIYIY